jgi:hypothetical protein
MLVLMKRGTCEVFSWYDLRSYDISTKLHDDLLRHSNNIKVITFNNLGGRSVGTTDGSDL